MKLHDSFLLINLSAICKCCVTELERIPLSNVDPLNSRMHLVSTKMPIGRLHTPQFQGLHEPILGPYFQFRWVLSAVLRLEGFHDVPIRSLLTFCKSGMKL